MGTLAFQVTGAFAEFERSMIRQRVKAGLKRAVAQGTKLGRPKVNAVLEREARKQLGMGILEGRLARYGCASDLQRAAVDLVVRPAEVMASGWGGDTMS
jgi:DNA invertase Pin-like site-specific DNA recombinase